MHVDGYFLGLSIVFLILGRECGADKDSPNAIRTLFMLVSWGAAIYFMGLAFQGGA